jgi:gamma-glutamylcyclotransferase
METVSYFAYGSNMDLDRMEERLFDFHSREELSQNRTKAILKGWRLEFNKKASNLAGLGYANIVKDDNDAVEGCLYYLSEEAFEELSGFEGVPYHYEIIDIEIVEAKNKSLRGVAV